MRSMHNVLIVVSIVCFVFGAGYTITKTEGGIPKLSAPKVSQPEVKPVNYTHLNRTPKADQTFDFKPQANKDEALITELIIFEKKLSLFGGVLRFAKSNRRTEGVFGGIDKEHQHNDRLAVDCYVETLSKWDMVNTVIRSNFTGVGYYQLSKNQHGWHLDLEEREGYLYWIKYNGYVFYTHSISAFADAVYSPQIVESHYEFTSE